MKTRLLFLLQWLAFTPCLSQSLDTEIHFFTRQGKLYTGVVTALADDSCTVQFGTLGLSLLFSAQQLKDVTQNTAGKAAKQAAAFGDEVEERLRQQAALRLGQLLQQCSLPESVASQCCFRFCELQDCDLYLFYTAKGYDVTSLDYHIVKIDLSAAFTQNPFGAIQSVEVRNSNRRPLIEIAKHTRGAVYVKEQFYVGDDWNNQPQYLTDLRLCFLDERQPVYQRAVKEMGQTLAFLCQSCKKKK